MSFKKLGAVVALLSVLLCAGPAFALADDGTFAQNAQLGSTGEGEPSVAQVDEETLSAHDATPLDSPDSMSVGTVETATRSAEANEAASKGMSSDELVSEGADEADGDKADDAGSADGADDAEGERATAGAQVNAGANEADSASDATDPNEDADVPDEEHETVLILLSSNGQETHSASISYRSHVQNLGWQDWCADGDMAGTSGLAYRMESLEFKVESDLDGAVYCQAHVENTGWQRQQEALVNGDGASVGTTGAALRIEALKFTLSGALSQWYDISYRVHVENEGWMDWRTNGALAGTTGKGLRIEALELRLVSKDSAPAKTASDGTPGLVYTAHVENEGWQSQKASSQTAGTTGKALRVEALEIWLDDAAYEGTISYRAHVQNIGWQSWVSAGEVCGTTGSALRLEAYQLTLTGDIADQYDIVYRAHVQNVGWQPWVVNGGVAGTVGKGLRVEAIQVKLVKKGSYSVSEGTYTIGVVTDASFAAEDPRSASDTGTQMKLNEFCDSQAQKFYIRKESSGIYSLQSVASGLFLADQGGKVVQATDTDSADHRWKLSWDGGVVLTNVGTGSVFALSSDVAAVGAKIITQADGQKTVQRWTLTSTQLIADGYYEIESRLGTYVDVANASYVNGANIQAHTYNGSGAQKFHIYLNNGSYVIENCMTFSVLDVDGKSTANGANVMQCTWNGGNNQRWTAQIDREGFITFVSKNSGKVLEIAGSSASGNIQQNASTGGQNQQWKLVPTERYSLSGDERLDRIVATVLKTHTTLRSVFDYVSYNYVYRNGSKHYSGWSLSDNVTTAYAVEMYTYGSGNCYRFACLFAWLARGLGYTDVVVRSGWVVGYSEPQAPHGWVEIAGYVSDPDMQNAVPSRNWFWQTYDGAPIAYYSW